MSERIITLFGEEIVPEQLKAVGRSRGKKKQEDKPGDTAVNEGSEEKEINTETIEDATLAPGLITKEERTVTDVVTEPDATIDTPNEFLVQPDTSTGDSKEDIAAVSVNEVNSEPAEEGHTAKQTAAENKKREKTTPANLPDDWQGGKQYYSIGEVAELFKVNTSHIRFWTNEFKLKVRTTRKGDRLYTPEQIKELRAINHLVKERGFTLKGAKTRLKTPEKMEVETVDLKQSLLQLRNKLVAIKNQLK